MDKVNLDTIKPWIQKRITELLSGVEDEVLIEYIFEMLEASKVCTIIIFFKRFKFYSFNPV